MRSSHFVVLLILLASFLQMSPYGLAQQATTPKAANSPLPVVKLGVFQAWQVYKTSDGVKYMLSYPIKEEGNYNHRSKPYLMISNFGGARVELSVYSGYKFKKDIPVEAVISLSKKDSKEVVKFNLTSYDENAWIISSNEEKQIIEKLKKSNTVTFYGESYKGTNSVDIYSLDGFTGAYKKITENPIS